ncbi:hypothetical protein NXC14_PA00254 (plasmid) [Rhizobium sp. NXC14]|nr:hypothetical protein NXC14_PA00254 [Rhizobium sp. NXC14]
MITHGGGKIPKCSSKHDNKCRLIAEKIPSGEYIVAYKFNSQPRSRRQLRYVP